MQRSIRVASLNGPVRACRRSDRNRRGEGAAQAASFSSSGAIVPLAALRRDER